MTKTKTKTRKKLRKKVIKEASKYGSPPFDVRKLPDVDPFRQPQVRCYAITCSATPELYAARFFWNQENARRALVEMMREKQKNFSTRYFSSNVDAFSFRPYEGSSSIVTVEIVQIPCL